MTDEGAALPRRLAAIFAADIAGYSRLMGEDEAQTVRALKGHQAVILPLIGRHGGRIIDTGGDGIMAEFPSVVGAARCAIEMQTVMATRNQNVPQARRMLFRVGICVSRPVFDQVSHALDATFHPLGPKKLKHLFLATEPAFAQFLEHTRAFLAG